jgi:RNA polymerase sigma-70 factor, ECF subfamily
LSHSSSELRPNVAQGDIATSWPELIQAARQGDDVALNQIWQELRSYLLMFTHRRLDEGLRGKLDASDVVQQSLLEAHRDFGGFRGQSEEELKSWTCKLVVHNLVDANRRFRESQKRCLSKEVQWTALNELATVNYDDSPSSLMRRSETDDELIRAIAQLPPRSQQVLELRHRMGFSHAQVAIELGMTEPAARKLWSRIVDELQTRLSKKNVSRSNKPQ